MTALATPPPVTRADAVARADPGPSTVERPRVQIRPVPVAEPPFDDDPPVLSPTAGVGGSPPERISRGPRPRRPVTPRPPRGPFPGPVAPPWPGCSTAAEDHHCGARAGAGEGGGSDRPTPGSAAGRRRPAGGDAPSSREGTPESRAPSPAHLAAQRFAQVCVEVLNGHRPATHLRAVTCPSELSGVTDQLMRRTGRVYLGRPGMSAPGPHRVQLRKLLVGEPYDGVAELALVLEYGTRSWAMAARLERRSDTWLCTLVQVI